MAAANAEPDGMRRRNFHYMVAKMIDQFREWRRDAPNRVEKVPNSTLTSPRMGDMSDEEIEWWARRISTADAEASINMTNEATARAKRRAGEAA